MPSLLRKVWDAWKELASYVGDFQARLILTAFYFTVAMPFALIARALDPLQIGRRVRRSTWVRRGIDSSTLAAAQRQS